jgi:hypothetical protein
MRRPPTTARQTQMAALLAAIVAAADSEVQEALGEVYDAVQSLGGPGLHSENQINRQEALDAINAVRRERRSSEPGGTRQPGEGETDVARVDREADPR